MNKLLLVLAFLPLAALAAEKHDAEQIKKDVQRHRTMAGAHEAMAKCLESGTAYEQCHRSLLGACKGLAIGKYCGMKHEH
jgi:hypothetical protein